MHSSKRNYHQGLSKAYHHKAMEHAALAQAHHRTGNAEGVERHKDFFRENMNQSLWHETEADLVRGPVDDITGEAYVNHYDRGSYQHALGIEPGMGWSRYQRNQ